MITIDKERYLDKIYKRQIFWRKQLSLFLFRVVWHNWLRKGRVRKVLQWLDYTCQKSRTIKSIISFWSKARMGAIVQIPGIAHTWWKISSCEWHTCYVGKLQKNETGSLFCNLGHPNSYCTIVFLCIILLTLYFMLQNNWIYEILTANYRFVGKQIWKRNILKRIWI